MIVYWFILIWIYVMEVFQRKFCRQELVDGVNEYRANRTFAVASICVLVFFAALRSAPIDTSSYIYSFNRISTYMSDFGRYVNTREDSQLFYGLEMIFKCYISDSATAWLSLLAVIQGICLVIGLRSFSVDYGMSLYIFVASCMSISWMFNGVRQFTAVCILFAFTKLLLKKKYILYILIILALSGIEPICKIFHADLPIWFLGGFHQSALLMIPVVIVTTGKAWGAKFWITLCVSLAVLFAMGGFETAVSTTSYARDMQNVEADTGANPFRAAVAAVPVMLILLKRREIVSGNTPKIIQLSCNMSVIVFVLYTISSFTSGIYVGRLPIYAEMYNLILIPWLIKHPYKDYSRILSFMLHCMYLLYFVYQMYIAFEKLSYASDALGIHLWGGTS